MHADHTLPDELTIYTVGELYPQCLSWARVDDGEQAADATDPAAVDRLRVDAQAVREVDAAGVQLLLSLANTLARQQRQLQLVGPSPALVDAFEVLGVGDVIASADLTEASS